ncbi:glycosyltransferase family A protein [Pontibacter sp. SGAir0037]|uniref:glycosyltransferase family 2 protein n=1 Tax=Pontibacter sp. SGAir0037 TaxID=2571030 RepID=UPI0010CD16C6|nr:glycosyltransferase family A protein [Pontibacter sp. SGAir0037]QCR22182.1 hypothetical protein C1N53_07390 [Pontibacter sp. SGAir0037]
MSDKAVISIIIPCYNSGDFLTDAIESVYNQTFTGNYTIIIVDDGSTDGTTHVLLKQLQQQDQKIKIFYQENKGPAAARNRGVRASDSKYLLFLDSDNKLRPEYIYKALKVLEANEEIGVVYGAPNFFGDSTVPRFTPHEFDMYTMHRGNCIDMCAVVRREAWSSVGGFDENRLLIGHEDWDLWIMIGAKGWKFHYIQEVLYDYRVREGSVIVNANQGDKVAKVLEYFHVKHKEILLRNFNQLYQKKLFYEQEHKNPFRLFAKYFYHEFLINLLPPKLKK